MNYSRVLGGQGVPCDWRDSSSSTGTAKPRCTSAQVIHAARAKTDHPDVYLISVMSGSVHCLLK